MESIDFLLPVISALFISIAFVSLSRWFSKKMIRDAYDHLSKYSQPISPKPIEDNKFEALSFQRRFDRLDQYSLVRTIFVAKESMAAEISRELKNRIIFTECPDGTSHLEITIFVKPR